MRKAIAIAGFLTVFCAACGSASSSTSSSAAAASSSSSPGGAVIIKSANVSGLGDVLVNDQGFTLYILSSEAGGKITCTDASGCTKAWPDTELPKGVTTPTPAGDVRTALLSTVKDASGSLYVTYAGYPLYTFAHDSGPGQSNGQGIVSFGGTWTAIQVDGTPASTSPSSPSLSLSGSSSSGGSGNGGYNYYN